MWNRWYSWADQTDREASPPLTGLTAKQIEAETKTWGGWTVYPIIDGDTMKLIVIHIPGENVWGVYLAVKTS